MARIRALGLLDHPGARFFEPFGQPILPDVGVFDDMVVDRDQFGIVGKHVRSFLVY